jgi:RHS repeat-associated protein
VSANAVSAGAFGTFTLNLRLPGQTFDPETGLHYNRQRYYDPALGQYLTPDPLGTPDGPNPYAYVAFDPLTNIDPDGLVLFAFDGTGNSDNRDDPAMAGGSLSNVVEFRDAYLDGPRRYVTGVGTFHEDKQYGHIVPDEYAKGKLLDHLTGDDPLYINDMGGNYSGPARIDRMLQYLDDEAKAFENDKAMDIDIVGFSRGAAQARDFANRITQASLVKDGKTFYKYKDQAGNEACKWVNFRFMGLFDTVLSTNFSGSGYSMAIPSQFAHVAQAVALNEHRSSNVGSYSQRAPAVHSMHWGGFPLESIGASSSKPAATRIELGFIGAHADIGGGFADNGLSKVALAWMLEQATTAGVEMDTSPTTIAGSVVLHDKSNNIQTGKPVKTCALCTDGEDRSVNGAVSGSKQRTMDFGSGSESNSMVYANTSDFITYQERSTLVRYTTKDVDAGIPRGFVDQIKTAVTGTVDVGGYVAWLKLNGYNLNQLQVQ